MRTALQVLALVGIFASAQAGVSPIGTDGKVPTLAPLLQEVTPAVVNIAVSSGSPEENNPLLQIRSFVASLDCRSGQRRA